jgi:hypothetical protein
MQQIDRDAEIAARYAQGQSTQTIARDLGLRMVEVIGRVRAMKLDVGAPAPAARAPLGPQVEVASAPAPLAQSALAPAASSATPKLRPLAKPVDALDDDEDDDFTRRAGCPRGWLVTEEQFGTLFTRTTGRFEDVILKRSAPARRHVGPLAG